MNVPTQLLASCSRSLAVITAVLCLGWATVGSAQITDSEESARYLADHIASSGGGSAEQYLEYARGLAKTLSTLSPDKQEQILGFKPELSSDPEPTTASTDEAENSENDPNSPPDPNETDTPPDSETNSEDPEAATDPPAPTETTDGNSPPDDSAETGEEEVDPVTVVSGGGGSETETNSGDGESEANNNTNGGGTVLVMTGGGTGTGGVGVNGGVGNSGGGGIVILGGIGAVDGPCAQLDSTPLNVEYPQENSAAANTVIADAVIAYWQMNHAAHEALATGGSRGYNHSSNAWTYSSSANFSGANSAGELQIQLNQLYANLESALSNWLRANGGNYPGTWPPVLPPIQHSFWANDCP